jgi:hypothetical protein
LKKVFSQNDGLVSFVKRMSQEKPLSGFRKIKKSFFIRVKNQLLQTYLYHEKDFATRFCICFFVIQGNSGILQQRFIIKKKYESIEQKSSFCF